jgi:hypothetical protein
VKASKSLSNSEVQQEQWLRHFDALSTDDREIIEQETREAKAACGSRLAVAKHLANVHDVLCHDLANAKQKRPWTLFLMACLPGLAVSRSQAFRDIKAWKKAKKEFPAPFLDAFLSSGYALSVRPTADEPLGKYTKPCERVLAELNSEGLNEKQCETVLAEVAATIKAEAKRNRVGNNKALTAEQKRNRLLADLHNSTIDSFEHLAKAIERGDSYESKEVCDDLQEFVCRLMTAMGVEGLELRQMSLPDGFRRLSLPCSAADSSEESAIDSLEESTVESSEETSDSEETNDEVAMATTAA